MPYSKHGEDIQDIRRNSREGGGLYCLTKLEMVSEANVYSFSCLGPRIRELYGAAIERDPDYLSRAQ